MNLENIRLNIEIQTINAETLNLQNQIETLKQQLTQYNAHLNGEQEQMDTANGDCNDDNRTALEILLKNELHVLSNDVEARIKLECDKMKKDLVDAIAGNANVQSAKRKKSNVNRLVPAMGMENTPTTSRAQIPQNNRELLNGVLKPPVENTTRDNKEVYEIHVSKFHRDQTESDIVEHIADKTGLSTTHFKVIKLISKKPWKQNNYVSFKIVTIDTNTYHTICDQSIWGEFEVRDFEPYNNYVRNNYDQFEKRGGFRYNNQNRNKHSLRKEVLDRNTFANQRYDRDKRNGGRSFIDGPNWNKYQNARYSSPKPNPFRRNNNQQMRTPQDEQERNFNRPPRFNQQTRFDQQGNFNQQSNINKQQYNYRGYNASPSNENVGNRRNFQYNGQSQHALQDQNHQHQTNIRQ